MQQEIDYIEERDGIINAYEFKWGKGKTPRMSKTFLNAYPNTKEGFITQKNYLEFLQ